MTTGRVSASPTVLRFNDGKDYFFHPLTDKEYDTIDEWLQTRYVTNCIRSLPKGLSQDKENSIINSAIKESLKLSFLTPSGAEMLATVTGMTFIAWLSLRKSHPELSVEDVGSLLLTGRNLALVNQAFRKVNAVPENPTKASTRKAKR